MPLNRIESPSVGDRLFLPLISIPVSSGFPSIFSDDFEEEINPIDWIVQHPSSTSWWCVEGNCFLELGIQHGDLVAIDRADVEQNGSVVLAVIDGTVTAKILRSEGKKVWLAPANRLQDYPRIAFTDKIKILGVIAGVARRYDLD